MKSKLFIIILIILFSGLEAESQTRDRMTVSGIVTAFNKYPLIKVEVVALKTGEIAYTDSIGRFLIQCFNKDALYLSASGFKNRKVKVKVKVKNNDIYLIDLVYQDNIANFYDAVHNGHIAEYVLQQAIIEDQKKNEKDYSRYNTIYELIQSEISKVRVSGTGVINMKRTSIGNQNVLFVVDDVVVREISMIAPYSVKSIQFADDAASKARYGVDGANGVLKIELK